VYTRAPIDLAIVAIIPARFGSTRLPGKPLSEIHGKPMVQHVYEAAREARLVTRVLVATDDERVAAAVRAFGGEVVMTSVDHASGTDRLAEAAESCEDDVVVNVQGDEPMLDCRWIDEAIEPLRQDPEISISTLSLPLGDLAEMMSPSVVKVVADARGNALYFSRSPIPYARLDPPGSLADAAAAAVGAGLARKHVGLYVYRREALRRFARLPPSPLEKAEGLEQLRALQDGMRIRVVETDGRAGVAVDTPEDLERARALMAAGAAPSR
jgi:3-deoxy-manno-octulosonate cytidylyltransferase (CMP-KDO synthetase)